MYSHNHKSKMIAGTALFVSLFAMASLFVPMAFAEENDPWTDIPMDDVEDMGEMWGTLIQFEYYYDPEIGNQAESIEWDFGDGSARSTDWNPQHLYTEKGVYYVVQHVTNSFEGGSEDWGYYKIEIMGKPYIDVIVPEGAPKIDNVYATINTAPVRPETDPTWEGHTFAGYFADPEHTVLYDWTLKINRPVTVYASFDTDSDVPPVTDDPEEPVTDDYVWNGTILLMSSIGIIMILVAIYTRNPFVAIVTLALITLSILGILDIIDIPEIFDNFDEIFGRQNL